MDNGQGARLRRWRVYRIRQDGTRMLVDSFALREQAERAIDEMHGTYKDIQRYGRAPLRPRFELRWSAEENENPLYL